MIDLRTYNLLRSLNPQSPMTPDMSVGSTDPLTQVEDDYQPSYRAEEDLRALLQQMPRREDYKPTLGDRLAAIGAVAGASRPSGITGGSPVGFEFDAASANKNADFLLNRNYNNAMEDYQNRVEPLGKLASLENTRNTNERLISSGQRTSRIAQQRIDETERNNNLRNENADLDREDRQKKTDAYVTKMQNSNLKSADDNGELVFVDPTSDPPKVVRTGIQTGKMTDLDKMNFQLDSRLEVILAQNKANKDLETLRQTGRTELEGVRQTNRIETKTTPAASSAAGSNATQKQAAEFTRAQTAYNEHPEWQPYISLDRNMKRFSIKVPPASSGFLGMGSSAGGNEKVLKDINQYIYGGAQSGATDKSRGKIVLRREIPGQKGKFAISEDDGKTWKVE